MWQSGDHYKYVAVYIDNFAFAVDDPKTFVANLWDKHKFKLKGTRLLDFHLRANFTQDQDGTLSMSPKKYITEQLASSYLTMFGEKPNTKFKSLLKQSNHPKVDTSDLLDIEGI